MDDVIFFSDHQAKTRPHHSIGRLVQDFKSRLLFGGAKTAASPRQLLELWPKLHFCTILGVILWLIILTTFNNDGSGPFNHLFICRVIFFLRWISALNAWYVCQLFSLIFLISSYCQMIKTENCLKSLMSSQLWSFLLERYFCVMEVSIVVAASQLAFVWLPYLLFVYAWY